MSKAGTGGGHLVHPDPELDVIQGQGRADAERTAEVVTTMEDSHMVLGSLMSNR